MKERYRKIPDISPDLYSFKGTFWGDYNRGMGGGGGLRQRKGVSK